MHHQATLVDAVWPGQAGFLRKAALVAAGSAALWISAKLQAPFYPVPMTMQVFLVLVIGMAYGARLGAATVAFYLFQGLAGLPVFAGTPEKGLGLAYALGPTGGYLAGFVMAAFVAGALAERGWGRYVLTTGLAMLAGVGVIYASGLAWLGVVIGFDKPLLALGFWPFLPAEAFKIALAMAVMPLAWRGVARFGPRDDARSR